VTQAQNGTLKLPPGLDLLVGIGNPEAVQAGKRCVDEDLNRCFSLPLLTNGARTSRELVRARELAPHLQSVGYLVDIHSTNTPSRPFVRMSGAVDASAPDDTRQAQNAAKLQRLFLASCLALVEPRLGLVLDPYFALGGGVCTTDDFVHQAGGVSFCFETGLASDTSSVDRVVRAVENMWAVSRLRGLGQFSQQPVEGVDPALLGAFNLFHPLLAQIFRPYLLKGPVGNFAPGLEWCRPFGEANLAHVHKRDVLMRSADGAGALRAQATGALLFPKVPELLEQGKPVGWLASYVNTKAPWVKPLTREEADRIRGSPTDATEDQYAPEVARLAFAALGFDAAPTLAQVKNAYRTRAKALHPDQGGSAEAFLPVQEAYNALVAAFAAAPEGSQAARAAAEAREREFQTEARKYFNRCLRSNKIFVAGLHAEAVVDLSKTPATIINTSATEHVLASPALRVGMRGESSLPDVNADGFVPLPEDVLPWGRLLDAYHNSVVVKGRAPSKALRDTIVYVEGTEHVLLYPTLIPSRQKWLMEARAPFKSPLLEFADDFDVEPVAGASSSPQPRARLVRLATGETSDEFAVHAALTVVPSPSGTTLQVRGSSKDDVGKSYLALRRAAVRLGACEVLPTYDAQGRLAHARGVRRKLAAASSL